ncbi:hypothetical protein [Paenibacillus xylanexedens]|uniref:hypothetical protein n=1 Tax=Paenibacillus xylanexedens TaxID=528191 RepID=UPI0016435E5E|nr:hypothetical protein [Paenibacillus xylanexedens]
MKWYKKYKKSVGVIDDEVGKRKEEMGYVDKLVEEVWMGWMNEIEEIGDEVVEEG